MTEPVPPRHPDNLEVCREESAAQFLKAARLATTLSGSAIARPGPFVKAALEAATWSEAHNSYCRAGIPIDEAVQGARRQLEGAMALVLATHGSDLPARDTLAEARQRFAKLGADPNKDMPAGIRSLIYGQASTWLAPHEVQAVAAASTRPHMQAAELDRVELASAKTSLPSLRQTLSTAWDAHLIAPDDPVLELRLGACLKETSCAMTLVFHDAIKTYFATQKAGRAAPTEFLLSSWELRREYKISINGMKRAMWGVAADLQSLAGLRLKRLEAHCKRLEMDAARPAMQIDEARSQLSEVRALIATCVYVRAM
ncbi:MAG: hypothetical protein H7332_04435 [Bdellovibrionales bacterium]|nr:hypothetical protein [Ramlibacter sp.]